MDHHDARHPRGMANDLSCGQDLKESLLNGMRQEMILQDIFINDHHVLALGTALDLLLCKCHDRAKICPIVIRICIFITDHIRIEIRQISFIFLRIFKDGFHRFGRDHVVIIFIDRFQIIPEQIWNVIHILPQCFCIVCMVFSVFVALQNKESAQCHQDIPCLKSSIYQFQNAYGQRQINLKERAFFCFQKQLSKAAAEVCIHII